jgi:uncharacterized membrane protein
MTVVVGALAAGFIIQHGVQSHPPVRDAQLAAMGQRGFQVFYSLVSAVFWVPLCILWWTHRHTGGHLFTLPWPLHPGLGDAFNAAGIALLTAGLMRPGPTSFIAKRWPGKEIPVVGIWAITRHPVLMGATSLSIGHMLLNGYAIDLLFWGSHVVVGALGAVHQDWRHCRARPEFAAFATKTSILPSPMRLGRVGGGTWVHLAGGLLLAAVLRYAHRAY